MKKVRAAITGIGGYVPEDKLTNFELEKMVDTTDEWIRTRTGIRERRILKGEATGTSFMAKKAVNEVLEKTNTSPKDIDCVICATVTPDMLFPATANKISMETGMTNAFGYDVEAACSGLLFSISIGAKYIESGFCKKVMIVGADKMSSITDYQDRRSAILFGDGAGALLMEPTHEELGFMDAIYRTDGSGREFLQMKAGGSMYPPSVETVKNREHFVFQEGKTVFKFAVNKMADVSVEIMKRNNLKPEDITYLVPHQANKRIIDATGTKMKIPPEKVMINIDRYGNTTGGTIPLCLWDWEDKLRKNDNLVLSAFGGGFTWGAIYLKWAYDPPS